MDGGCKPLSTDAVGTYNIKVNIILPNCQYNLKKYWGCIDAEVYVILVMEKEKIIIMDVWGMKGAGYIMEKRTFDKLGIETSLLGFGCMRFPTLGNGKIDEVQAEKMLDAAIAEGVNYIDTAYPYHNGDSEPFVGRVLQKYNRQSYYLATKLPVWAVDNLEDAERIFEEQLERLKTDYVDFYLLHALSKDRWEKAKKLKLIEFCEKLKEEGKIKYLGFSFHDEYGVFEEILRSRDWDFCQIQLNYMDTEEQAGGKGYRLTEEMGVPLIIMEPIKGGSLARFSQDIEERFRALSEEATAASFALRWAGSLENVKVVLSGMSDMEQVADNLKTFRDFRQLTEKENQEIRYIAAILKDRVQNGCTGCGYCMPCPAGVDIPGCFKVWNKYHMYRRYEMVGDAWEKEIGGKAQAGNCIQCGKCETLCPQHITIREDLKKVQADMEKKVF